MRRKSHPRKPPRIHACLIWGVPRAATPRGGAERLPTAHLSGQIRQSFHTPLPGASLERERETCACPPPVDHFHSLLGTRPWYRADACRQHPPAPITQTPVKGISPALSPSPSMCPMGSSRQRCSQERRNDVWVSGCGAGDEVQENSSFSNRGAPRGSGVDFLVQSGVLQHRRHRTPHPAADALTPIYPQPPPGEKFASTSGSTQVIQAQVGNASEEGHQGVEGGGKG